MSTLQEEIQAFRKTHPLLSFEESWNHVMAAHPEFETSSTGNRVAAKLAPLKEKEARENFEHVEAIARRLMARDKSLPFGIALERVRLCLPQVQREIADLVRQSVKAVETEPKPRTMLIRGHEASYVD